MLRTLIRLIGLVFVSTFANPVAAPGLSISPATMAVDANGVITHTITGLQPGETVTVERIADVTNLGAIDFGEPSLRIFKVTDGARSTIGGVINFNVANDDDATVNGAIRIDLPYPGTDVIFNRQPGKQIVRVTNATGQTATALFEITPNELDPPSFGVLKNSADNANISFGIIVILVGDGDQKSSVRTDGTGNFTFIEPPGDYAFVPFADGFVAEAQSVHLPANDTVSLQLTPAATRISGKLSDAISGEGLPGVFILAQTGDGEGFLSGGITDVNGNYAFSVTPGSWEIRPMAEMASALGYVVDEAGPILTVGASAIVQNFTAQKATALVRGQVVNGLSNPLVGSLVRAQQEDPLKIEAFGRANSNGDYVIGLVGGNWEISADEFQEHIVATAGAVAQANFTVLAPTATLSGRVVNSLGNGIGGVEVSAFLSPNVSRSAATEPDGSFSIPVFAGEWSLQAFDLPPNLIGPSLTFNVVDGNNIQNIQLKLLGADVTISGTVESSTGAPISGLGVYANATIDGQNYSVPFTQTDPLGHYSWTVTRGQWSISLACADLSASGFNCPLNQIANTILGSVVKDFVVTLKNSGVSPHLTSPRIERNGAATTFEFTIAGDPGTYDILARTDLPTSIVGWTPVSTATIGPGASSVLARFDPREFHFFRAQLR